MLSQTTPSKKKSRPQPTPYICPFNEKIAEMCQSIAVINSTLTEYKGLTEKNSEVLWGNGNEGLRTQVSKLYEDVAFMKRMLNGDGKDDGMFTKLSKLLEYMSVIKRGVWVIISIVIGIGAVDIIYLMVTHPIKGITIP